MTTRLTAASKTYWDAHPIGAEIVDAEPGSHEFYRAYLNYYDRFYDYKWSTFQYDRYTGKDVLEIGCGLGIDTVKFAKSGANVTAIDLSSVSVNCTRRLLQDSGLPGDIREGDAQRLEFPDNSFDVVYAYGVLMHVENVDAAIDEIHRVLRPGGRALVVLYHRWSWYWLLVRLSGTNVESEPGDPPVNRVYSRSEVWRLFSRFSSVQVTCNRFPKPTRRRRGYLADCYNHLFVAAWHLIPRPLVKPFGWHLIVTAVK
jgi:2-polyprenyl-3-methyl-5-hydroxy-6-metoxy-1,4-benzoquinol methylase